jgi:hypothetical protein
MLARGVLIAVIMGSSMLPISSWATCDCRCVNGQIVPLCDNTLEIAPICPPTICDIVPPSVRPIGVPTIPPIGTQYCAPEQVLNPYTHMYEWRTICR